jgi:hypothetical protein
VIHSRVQAVPRAVTEGLEPGETVEYLFRVTVETYE